MIQSSEQVLDEIVRFLEEHEEALRIKKLIFCISKKQWENDINILNKVSLKSLIQELLSVKPNRYQLTFSVYKVIKILNRPAAYEAVANIVIEKIAQLYNLAKEGEEGSNSAIDIGRGVIIPEEITRDDPNLILQQIAQNLETNREEVRIKKLIFAACKKRWENDIHVIDQFDFKKLLLEIRNIYETPNDLRRIFSKISENLNKPSLYAAISNIIVEQLLALYQISQAEPGDTRATKTQQVFNAQIIQVNNSYNLKPDRGEAFETSVVDLSNVSKAYPTQETAQILPINAFEPSPLKPDSRIAGLKIEIMQSTNPLRVKILLFSILEHPWEQSDQDWAMIKTYTLNDLFQQLLYSKKSLKQIESELQIIAKSLPASDDNLQCVNTLVEVLKKVF